jgi:hypothetical protein
MSGRPFSTLQDARSISNRDVYLRSSQLESRHQEIGEKLGGIDGIDRACPALK